MHLLEKYNQQVEALENAFEDSKKEVDKELLKERAHELLENLKRTQDTEEYFEMNDDLEEIIYRVIEIIGQL